MGDELNIVIFQSPGDLGNPVNRLNWLKNQLLSGIATGSDLLILPELFQSGYNSGDIIAKVAEPSDGPFATEIMHIAIAHDIAIAYGYAEKTADAIYNSAQCIDRNGRSIGHHRKLLLPPGFEARLFAQGSVRDVFELGSFKLCILICYDIEFPENVRQVASAGVDLVIAPTALGDQWGIVSEKLVPTRAFENGVFIAYAKHSGNENDMAYFGGSCIVAPGGNELARADREFRVLKARLEKYQVVEAQQRLPYLAERLKLSGV